jgi:hypothetical protein
MTLTIPLEDTVVAFHQLHPLRSNLVLPPIFDYQHEHTFVLDNILIAQTLAITPHLFLGGLSKMVYEHFSIWFILEDPSSKKLELFQATAIVTYVDIPRSVALVLGANRLLAMTKDTGGLHLITVGGVFF